MVFLCYAFVVSFFFRSIDLQLHLFYRGFLRCLPVLLSRSLFEFSVSLFLCRRIYGSFIGSSLFFFSFLSIILDEINRSFSKKKSSRSILTSNLINEQIDQVMFTDLFRSFLFFRRVQRKMENRNFFFSAKSSQLDKAAEKSNLSNEDF